MYKFVPNTTVPPYPPWFEDVCDCDNRCPKCGKKKRGVYPTPYITCGVK